MTVEAAVDVWTIPLPRDVRQGVDDREYRRSMAVLDENERARATRFAADEERIRFVSAHSASREILARYLGMVPSAVRWKIGEHGKPLAAGARRLEWTFSRSDDWALVAVLRTPNPADATSIHTTSTVAVGVDIQSTTFRFATDRFARRFLTGGEATAFPERPLADRVARAVAYKEACAKAVGGRLLDLLDLETAKPGDRLTATVGKWKGQRWQVADLTVPPGHVGAVALSAPIPFMVCHRVWNREDRA